MSGRGRSTSPLPSVLDTGPAGSAARSYGGAAYVMTDVPLVYKMHILLGFSIFLISPFTRMIHIWSGVGALAYLFRPYQIVRTPRTRAKEPVRL